MSLCATLRLLALALLLVLLPSALQAQSFRTELIDNGNGFTVRETFRTSTADAATGYDAYATWDGQALFFGVTGQDVGDPACDPAETTDCPVYERGQSIGKYIAYYFDTDPIADATGTQTAYTEPDWAQSWTLTFKADYLVLIRTDGVTSQEGFYTGNAALYEWDGAAWAVVEPASGPAGNSALKIGDNNTSNYLEFSVERAALDDPDFLRTAAWFFNTDDDPNTAEDDRLSYAYWPENAVEGLPADGAQQADPDTIRHSYGFVLIDGQTPAASNGQANRDRPFVAGLTPQNIVNGVPAQGGFGGRGLPFHSTAYTNSNDFSGNEAFLTSTTESADTGYDAYATWDDENLSFGYTGSDIGGGDCSDLAVPDCDVFELGQSPEKWIVYYFDTDPTGDDGTTTAEAYGDQTWTLPFKADYYVAIRTDGVTIEGEYTGVADLKSWDGSAWVSKGPVDNLEIFDNSSSGFLKFTLDQGSIGNPSALRVVSWVVNAEDFAATEESDEMSYAYWPASAPADGEADADGTTGGATVLDEYYGFQLDDAQLPNASSGLANLNRPFFGTYECADFPGDEGENLGTSLPFHTVPINGSNGFNTANEAFATSTTADTGYDAYATWDANKLYFGYTGSDVGGGDCSDLAVPDCDVFELGQSPEKWIVYYFDTDPTGDDGTTTAYVPSDTIATDQSWTLPFRADYALYIRTDGASRDVAPYTGVSELKRYDDASGTWQSLGPCGLEIYDNNTSGFLEFSLDLSDLGNPFQLKTVAWLLDAERDSSFAYWPEDAPEAGALTDDGVTTGAVTLDTYWGFELRDGIIPNGPGNKNRTFFESVEDQVTFTTYTINGDRDAVEQLPQEYLGRESAGAPALYLTWDADNLYLSFADNPLVDTNADLYVALDTDPALSADPQGGGSGLARQPDVGPAGSSPNQPTYPFAADAVFRLAGTAQPDASVQDPAEGELYTASDESWSQGAVPTGTQIIRQAEGPTEVAIPWSALGSLSAADSSYFHLLVYLNDSGNGIDAQWPTSNPQGQNPPLDAFFSYYLQPGVEPFSRAYRSIRTTSGSTLADGLYGNVYLIVPNPEQNSATWSLGANTTVVNELYLGPSAVLDVGDNSGNPSGHNNLRFGRRFTSQGDLLEREGTVFTFDPAVGFPEEDQPAGGFATPSFTSKILCDATFYELNLLNDTEILGCPSGGGGSSVRVAALRMLPHQQQATTETSTVSVDGTLDLSEGSLDTGGNDFTLGEDATVTGRDSGNRIIGGVTRVVETADPISLAYPVGGDATRDLVLTVSQLTPKPTAYTVEEIPEPAPDLRLPPGVHEVSDVRYFTIDKAGVNGGPGALISSGRLEMPYGPDNGLGDPETFHVVRGVHALFYLSLGGTLVDGSNDERGAVRSRAFFWPEGIFALASGDPPRRRFAWFSRFEAVSGEDGAVALSWQPHAEAAGGGTIEVQRSLGDSTSFETIATLDGAPEAPQDGYRFKDAAVPYEAATIYYRLRQAGPDGAPVFSPLVVVDVRLPEKFALQGNFPNPFRGRTTIRYALPEAQHVRLSVYDLLGREVAVLVDEEQPAGRKEVRFDAQGLASGVYLYRLSTGGFTGTEQMVIVR